MIDGLKIQMSSEELASRLTQRAEWNEATASGFDAQLRLRPADRDDPLMADQILEHESIEHRARATTLRLLRDHLVPGEIYLLGEQDLQFADLIPELNVEIPMASRDLYEVGDAQ